MKPDLAKACSDDALEALRHEVQRLHERIEALEQGAAVAGARDRIDDDGALSDELIAVISAALAAYLGVKPRIRQIVLAGGASWAQQGRVTIQASHALTLRHDQE